MLQHYLVKILIFLIALDLVIAGVMVIFMINIRIILKKRFMERRFEIRAMKAAQKSTTSKEAAKQLGIPIEEFTSFCTSKNIMLPEERTRRKEEAERRKQEDMRRIMEEEAAWRAEQDRIAEERRKEKEEETKRRKERLKKFGII